jgi:hypothetical protein
MRKENKLDAAFYKAEKIAVTIPLRSEGKRRHGSAGFPEDFSVPDDFLDPKPYVDTARSEKDPESIFLPPRSHAAA